ncbi:hypothetical protein SEA_OLGASCLOVER_71 [Gordonia phage OlgasClover]|uniref:Uncharacterized protein n=2 Tax=Kenoshavirus TaxID=2842796 RepID=A0A410TCM7_9CAUD|nr:hypothetical protein HWC06_gp70 [Gordonia phage Duffington]YP_009852171.1 hypothetical protein HWC66_gp69 [Gordonia phage Chikenjars]QAU06776.1 hypothetical protein SEA_DUFFINGTON_70 [Gordonia phage Duffington]QEQ94372.1 hypothetical protein SEA_CHIKENJARS_69 [Gordonia phage Chikenjars]WNT45146.1 hypothetical protein SEA_OLGASCLOVER_71 [Gordonia phage OlgasClover]
MGYTTETPAENSSPKPKAPATKNPRADIKTQMFQRKPFQVEAVQITEENFEKVASWCGGSIATIEERGNTPNKPGRVKRYIQVGVSRPMTRRQSEAYVGDWILYAPQGFKVYANRPFLKNFETVPQELFVTDEPVKAPVDES